MLWDSALLKLIDIRHAVLSAGEELRCYRFPASCFIVAVRGAAKMRLEGSERTVDRFHVLHGGKGTSLHICPTGDRFEYYLIAYQARLPATCRKELLHLEQQHRPFQLQYSFVPLHPATLLEQVRSLSSAWRAADLLNRLSAKAFLYQFVHEVLQQLAQFEVDAVSPTLSEQISRYLHEYYREPITRETLARLFHYHPDYVSRQFKAETGCSVIDYLIGIRMEKAKEWLRTTDMTIQEAAEGIGYADVSYFIRLFKKQTGCTPKRYKELADSGRSGQDRPTLWSGSSLVPFRFRRYIDISFDNDYQYKGEGEHLMNKHKLSGAATLLLCAALLLSACSAGTGTNNASSGNAPTQVEAKSGNATEAAQNTVQRFKHVMGEIDVPASPQRIAGLYLDDHLLALGIQPVIETSGAYKHFYLENRLGEAVKINPTGINFEAVLSTKPDLIVLNHPYYGSEGKYEQYSKIAPTYVFDDGQWWLNWRDTLRTVGDLTGKKAEAEQFIARYEAKAAAARDKLRSAIGNETAALIRVEDKRLILYGGPGGYSGDVLYTDLGIAAPEIVRQLAWGEKPHAEISLEMIPQLTVDHLFVTTYPNDDSRKRAEELFASRLWQELPAVKNNRVYPVNLDHWMTAGPLAYELKVDDVLQALSK